MGLEITDLPRVDLPWDTTEMRASLYHTHQPVDWYTHLKDKILFASPLSLLVDVLQAPDRHWDVATVAAAQAKAAYPNDHWRQIGHLSAQVREGVRSKRWITPGEINCRDYAGTFRVGFDLLNIPNANVGMVGTLNHVVNRITVRATTGAYYAYAIDVGWAPLRLFPLTRLAIEHQGLPPLD